MNRHYLISASTFLAVVFASVALAQVTLPGTDASDKLEAAGTLLRLVDTAIFTWGARVFAGLCVFSAGWALKEQRFGVAVICILAAIVIGTTPMWIKNIFSIGSGSLFTLLAGGIAYV